MPTVDERLASLEATVEAIADLRADMNARFAEVHQRLTQIDGRFTQIDGRFTQIDGRFNQVEGRLTLLEGRFTGLEGRFTGLEGRVTELQGDMNRRFASLDAKVDRNFVWLAGMMVTGFVAIIGALVGTVYR